MKITFNKEINKNYICITSKRIGDNIRMYKWLYPNSNIITLFNYNYRYKNEN